MPDKASLAGKTALVTGGAKRIGRAISLALASVGIDVVIHYRNSEKEAAETASQLRESGVNAWTVSADLNDTSAAKELVGESVRIAGKLDFLINNASIFPPSTPGSMSVKEIHEILDVNALSPFELIRAFASTVETGAVVNILDSRIDRIDRKHAAYQLSKNTLRDLTELCAVEYAPGIRINAVAPGIILPPPGKDSSHLKKLSDQTLLGRHGTAEDIADAVLYLLGAEFVTGQIITVDGGENLKRIAEGLTR